MNNHGSKLAFEQHRFRPTRTVFPTPYVIFPSIRNIADNNQQPKPEEGHTGGEPTPHTPRPLPGGGGGTPVGGAARGRRASGGSPRDSTVPELTPRPVPATGQRQRRTGIRGCGLIDPTPMTLPNRNWGYLTNVKYH